MLSGGESFSFNKIECNLTTKNQGVWSIRECYVPNIRDTRLVEVHRKNAKSMEDDLLQHVSNFPNQTQYLALQSPKPDRVSL